ncbi:MAG TPA: permease prefix domain 2-containing transporter [Fulvivirga sp.]|nr:permease prefix domain 2-containing transporter [Fulvivirga sp.]
MSKQQPNPPKLAKWLLNWFLKKELAEEVTGDLDEKYHHTLNENSTIKAKLNYWYQVFNYLRPFALKHNRSNSNYFIMYQHNFKLTYRNLLKYKSSFIINVIGLSTGLACALLIFLWVSDEISIDKFHKKDQHLYQVLLNHDESGILRTGTESPGIMAEALQQEIPEITMSVEDTPAEWFDENFSISDGKNFIKAKGKFSGKDYFKLFSFPFKHGDPSQSLTDKSSIVITESLALKLFGTTENLLGKMVDYHLLHIKKQAQITGVIKDLPLNSTIQFDFVLPFEVFKDIIGKGMHWGNYNAVTFVEVANGTNISALNNKLGNFIKEKLEGSNVTPFVSKFSDNYLYGNYENGIQSGGRITYVKLFSLIGLFVLAIACINFMNLTTARASRRLKEIGVKKALGAQRSSLVVQFLSESVLVTVFSLLVAFGMVWTVLPQFNEITGKFLSLQFNTNLVVGTLSLAIVTGLLAGSYPALYLSGFKPIHILKGKLNASFGDVWIRKGLVIFQFSLSIIMIVCVLVVYQQIEYIQSKNLGYDKENILSIPMEGQAVENTEAFMAELKNVPGVINASCTSHTMVKNGSYTTGVSWPGKNPDVEIRFEQAAVYYGLIETLGIQVLQGRSFSKDYASENTKIMLNEAAINVMGLEDPIGKTVNLWGADMEVIGVVKNFNYASLHNKVEPMLFRMNDKFFPHGFIKISANNIPTTIQNIENFYKKFNPEYALEYTFLDQNFQAQYIAEARVSVLSRYFASIAIIISCLGLFGLAAFTAERRQKEIGVRKILGAGHLKIIALLSNDFTKMVLSAILIALPIGYYISSNWLGTFVYHIQLRWWFFALSGLLALIIAWLTISFQTIRAANINPVKCLKED